VNAGHSGSESLSSDRSGAGPGTRWSAGAEAGDGPGWIAGAGDGGRRSTGDGTGAIGANAASRSTER
jgi:hypothetical protein